MALIIGAAVSLNAGWYNYMNTLLLMNTFFFSQWDVYFTGVLQLWYINVTEAQFYGMMVYVLPSFFGKQWCFIYTLFDYTGQNMYLTKVGDLDVLVRYLPVQIQQLLSSCPFLSLSGPMTLGQALLIPSQIVVILFFISSLTNVFTAVLNNKANIWRVLEAMVPPFAAGVGFTMWMIYDSNVAHSKALLLSHPYMVCLALGFTYVNLVGTIVTNRVCRLEFSPFQKALLPLPLVPLSYSVGLPMDLVLLIFCIYEIGLYLWFAISVIQDMTTFLKIRCFSIPHHHYHHTK